MKIPVRAIDQVVCLRAVGCLLGLVNEAAEQPRWMAQEFTRGCYGAPFAPGVWTSYGEAWRAPVGFRPPPVLAED